MLTRKQNLKIGKKLIAEALNGFYAFEDDAVETFIDKLLIKYKNQKLRKATINKYIKNGLISHPVLGPIVIKTAVNIWGNNV